VSLAAPGMEGGEEEETQRRGERMNGEEGRRKWWEKLGEI
jgi:hypothetical protein